MVNKLLFGALFALTIWSCSKDAIEEQNPFNAATELLEESTTIIVDETVVKQPLSNIEKTANWIAHMQGPNGLIESAENTNFVSLYDNALAAMVFIQQGDFERAEQILNFFEGRMQTELNAGSGGFYQFRDRNGENGSRTWMGDNAWLLIAIHQYHEAFGNQKYHQLATDLENWLRSLQDSDGGLRGGLNEDGSEIPKVTEGILTAFNAVKGYDDFHMNILQYLKTNRWNPEENLLVAWPENEAYNYALDLHSLSYSILKDFPESTLTQTYRYENTQIATVTGKEVTGYCFDEDKDVIWLEGTAQMAVAYENAAMGSKTNSILVELEKALIASPESEDALGLPYTSNHGTNYGGNTLWDHADLTPALSSTAWYLFAKMHFNPFEIGEKVNLRQEDQFWLNNFN